MQLLGRLRFDDQFLINNHVDALNPENMPFVRDLNACLTCDAVAARNKFVFERTGIHRFEKAITQSVVYLEERSNN